MKLVLLIIFSAVVFVSYLNGADINDCKKNHSADVCYATINP